MSDEIEKKAINYLNQHKQKFLERYTQNIYQTDEKLVVFTAGMSGVGKTEFAIFLKEQNPNLLHIDTDAIREFFKPIGYNGQNSDLFQKVASRGFDELFSFAMKKGYSMILDSNFASIQKAKQNIERLLKRAYNIEIVYLYDDPVKCFEYAIQREVVTKRRVPKDVFLRSNENSFKTVITIKKIFENKIILNFIDKRDGSYYQNIDEEFLKTKIGGDFEF